MEAKNTPTLRQPPTILVIFGITGDLAKRYLLPSIYRLFRDNMLSDQTEIIAVSRKDIFLDDLFDTVELCVNETDKICDPVTMARMHSHTRTFQLDMDDPTSYSKLHELLDKIENDNGVCMNRLYYLSVPPDAYGTIIEQLGAANLNASCAHGKATTQLLVEKPFGHDPTSAKALIEQTSHVFGEDQIYRIDHYLAKETAQNILSFRFQNPLFETVWNNTHIESIDIVASESIGINGRGVFYERQGALRDFIQNHLLQLLAIVTMDKPEKLDSDHIHAAKLELLRSIKPATQATRGQYKGYRDEAGNPKSHVETYAAINTSIDSPRWQGVPITIRTGKAMAERYTIITLTFKGDDTKQTNVLRFWIQPNEGIELSLLAKKPGFDKELQRVNMDFSYDENFKGPRVEAYERVLADAVRGDRTLFTSSQEVLAAWAVVGQVVDTWEKSDEGLRVYEPGTAIDTMKQAVDNG